MEFALLLIICSLLLVALISPQLTGAGQWANPLLALCLPHAMLILAYLLALESGALSFQLGTKAISLLAAGYFAFIFGVVLIALPYNQSHELATLSPKELYLADKLARISLPVLFLAVAAKYTILVRSYGNPLTNIIPIRVDYVAGVLDYSIANPIALAASNFLMLNLGILMGAGVKNRRNIAIFSFFLLILNDVTVGGANWTFSNFCLFLCAWAITKERVAGLKISWQGLLKLLMIAGATATVIFALLSFRSEGSIGGEVSFLDVLLYYAGGDIATFGYFVEFPYTPNLPGSYTLGGLYGLFDLPYSLFGNPMMPPLNPEIFVADIGSRFNTSIHFSHYYSDFGEIGLIIVSFVLGLFTMWAMAQYRQRFTLVRVQYFALLLYITLVSIRGVPTEGKYFWILLLILPFLRRITYFVPIWKGSPLITAPLHQP